MKLEVLEDIFQSPKFNHHVKKYLYPHNKLKHHGKIRIICVISNIEPNFFKSVLLEKLNQQSEGSIDMQKLTPEEEQKIYDSAPIGTWTILFIYGVLVLLGWGYLWARFVGFGAIN